MTRLVPANVKIVKELGEYIKKDVKSQNYRIFKSKTPEGVFLYS